MYIPEKRGFYLGFGVWGFWVYKFIVYKFMVMGLWTFIVLIANIIVELIERWRYWKF